MHRSAVYVGAAIALGLAMTLGPTWFFTGPEQRRDCWEVLASFGGTKELRLPLLEYAEQNHVDAVSSREVGVLGLSFLAASIVYLLFRRRVPRRYYTWPPLGPS